MTRSNAIPRRGEKLRKCVSARMEVGGSARFANLPTVLRILKLSQRVSVARVPNVTIAWLSQRETRPAIVKAVETVE